MKHIKLDRIDLKILHALQREGRMTNVDLSKQAGISAPPCLRRVRALEKGGYIRGYHADIAPDRLGFGLTVFVQVSLANHGEGDFAHFAKLVDTWPLVRECHMLTGEMDFILKVVAEDWEGFQKFLTQLSASPNVQHIKSTPVMRRTKFEAGVPIDVPEEKGAKES